MIISQAVEGDKTDFIAYEVSRLQSPAPEVHSAIRDTLLGARTAEDMGRSDEMNPNPLMLPNAGTPWYQEQFADLNIQMHRPETLQSIQAPRALRYLILLDFDLNILY